MVTAAAYSLPVGPGGIERAIFEVIVMIDERVYRCEIESGGYPLVRRFLGANVDETHDRVTAVFFDETRFQRGLERLLDGVEANLGS